MNIKHIFLFAVFLITFLFPGFTQVRAATFFVLPKSGEFTVGQVFDVELRINSDGQGLNAAQATIQFPKGVLEVKSIDFTPTASIFNFWLDQPKFSNADGKITFIGGTTNGVVGASIPILKITFFARASGEDYVTLSDAAITASDGNGTNILSNIVPAYFKIKPIVEMLASSSTGAPTGNKELISSAPEAPLMPVPPVQIIRTPISAQKLPEEPKITVPLYPDPVQWYGVTTNFLAQWKLPEDISGVSTIINQNSIFVPAAKSEGLFEAKTFSPLKEGIWYLHVRFQNNVGWGRTAHYRLAIDTFPPLPFTIDSIEGLNTDFPSPTLTFQTNDGLSGLQNYLVRIDNGDVLAIEEGKFTLPLQEPGKHIFSVRAADKAGNIRESSVDFEILPIASPVIIAISKDIFTDEENLTVTGTAIPDISVLLFLKSKKEASISQAAVQVDKNGNWEAIFNGPFKKGKYFVEIKARDKRGALSLSVKSDLLKVRERPLVVLVGLEITQSWFFVGLIIILLIGFGIGWFFYKFWQGQIKRRATVAQRDVWDAFTILKNNIDKMLKNYTDKYIDKREASEMEFLLKKARNYLEEAQKYIIQNIKEIGD